MNTKDGPTKLVRQDAILGGLSKGQLCDNRTGVKQGTMGNYVTTELEKSREPWVIM